MQKKYVVRLTESERDLLNRLVKKPRVSAQRVLRARVLLKTDADGPHWTDAAVANAFDCRTKTIENIRERFVTEGFEITLNGIRLPTIHPSPAYTARVASKAMAKALTFCMPSQIALGPG